jgi:hypothetical protein
LLGEIVAQPGFLRKANKKYNPRFEETGIDKPAPLRLLCQKDFGGDSNAFPVP